MNLVNILSKTLLLINVSVISLYASAAPQDTSLSCTEAASFEGLIGSGTTNDPYQIPLDKCIELNGNSGQQYVFTLDLSKNKAEIPKLLAFLARSFNTNGTDNCDVTNRASCIDTNNRANLTVTPEPNQIIYKDKGKTGTILFSINPDPETYTMTISSKAALLDFILSTKAPENSETNFSPIKQDH